MSQRYAPGIRVEIRDAEWRIKRIDHTSDGGELLTCEGLSELVRGREATFLTKIEPSTGIVFTPSKGLVDVGLPRTALTNGISYSITRADNTAPAGADHANNALVGADHVRDSSTAVSRAEAENVSQISAQQTGPTPVRAGDARDNEQSIAPGWNDIRDLTAGDTVSKTYTDTTQATGPVEGAFVYQAPLLKPNRE